MINTPFFFDIIISRKLVKMSFIDVLDIILVILLIVMWFETMIKLKKSEGKLLEKVRKPLLVRIDIIIVLIVLVFIVGFIRIVMRS